MPKIALKGSKVKELSVQYEKDYYSLVKKGENDDFKLKTEFNNKIKAPIKKGDVVGKTYITKNGVVVAEINIVSKENLSKQTYKDSFNKVIDNFSI